MEQKQFDIFKTAVDIFLAHVKTFDKRIHETLKEWINDFEPKKDISKETGFFLYGSVGTGKTTLACKLAINWFYWQINNRKSRIAFIIKTYQELLNDIRSTYGKNDFNAEQLLLRDYQTCPLLILDDIGITPVKDWHFHALYTIIDFRYRQKLPIIFTSNNNLDTLRNLIGDERLMGRIEHMCLDNVLKVEGVNHRKQ